MEVHILDDWFDTLSSLPCFDKLSGHDVTVWTDHVEDTDALSERLSQTEALVLFRERTKITAELLDRLPNLKLISQRSVYPHVDVEACTKNGVLLCSNMHSGTPSYAAAEMTLALMLASYRQIPQQVASIRQGNWQMGVGRTLRGRTLGLYGYGRIAKAVAGYAQSIGMNVQWWASDAGRARAEADGATLAASRADFFETSDIVSLHVRLKPETRGIVTAEDLAAMKPRTLLVNTSRSGLISPGVLEAEIAKGRIQIMIDRGMDNDKQVLQGLIDKAEARIAQIRSGEKPPLMPDANAKYAAEFVVDLDQIVEPMIADPDVHNDDPSKRYTHDTIRPISFYGGTKTVDLGFVGSCMVHKGDMKILAQMLKNIEAQQGTVAFKAPLVVAPPTYNIVNELKEEGDWAVLAKYAGFEFDDDAPKTEARTAYENTLYLERPGCNLCMGNQEKAEKGDTVMATSTRLFQGRVVADADDKKGESLLASTPVVVLSTILGRTPSIEEYTAAVKGIKLTSYAPPAS